MASTSLQRQNPIIHWIAVIFALISLIPPLFWLLSATQNLFGFWIWIDVGLGVFFGLEFLTRSGLHRNPASYMRTRFFDFVAVVPVLVLVYYQVPYLQVLVWVILAARFGRLVDRILGDGFWTRNFFALLKGFEEEITDRVMLRIVTPIKLDLERGSFANGFAEALEQNKQTLLQRVHKQHPKISFVNSALERAEEHTFDAVVEIIKSPGVDRAIRDGVDSLLSSAQKEMKVTWRQNLGIKPDSDVEV